MSFLALIKPLLSTKNGGFRSSISGLLMGAPLGVCVNCAAPIAYGLYTKGSRIETALSMMISSPTLNIVVVTMAFALFPFHMVMVKLVLIVIVILVMIPLLARWFPDEIHVDTLENEVCETGTEELNTFVPETKWFDAFLWVAKEVLANAWQMLLKVIPLYVTCRLSRLSGYQYTSLGCCSRFLYLTQVENGH